MRSLHLVVRLTYDPQTAHSGEDDPEAKRYFFEHVLGGRLVLTSPELGKIGEVEVVEVSDEEAPRRLIVRPATHIPSGTSHYPDTFTAAPDSGTGFFGGGGARAMKPTYPTPSPARVYRNEEPAPYEV
ncbi:MAG TPA: hypothetical protein ENJ54_04540 [Chloroflexi bacterium]|nr:hypothetical protein [Chloroflexota bacterium]